MKRVFFVTVICCLISIGISAQNNAIRYEIEAIIGANSLRIGGREMKVGDKFYETDKIEWTDKKQAIKVSEVQSPGKGAFSLDKKSMGRSSSIREFLERRSNGSHRSAGELEIATKDGFPQKRIAFVIGNSYYDYNHNLANAALDAQYITEALQNKGFDVILELNGCRAEFDADFEWFLKLANDYGKNCVALLYYAGHGIQLEDKDYLVPSDARLTTTALSKVECIEINEIVKQLQSNTRLQNLIIVDACRNKKSRGSEYDFMAPSTDDGTNVLYSTKSGDVAYDGQGFHSTFAEAFVKVIQIEGYTWGQIAENILYEVKDKVGQTGLQFGFANRNFIFTPSNGSTNLSMPSVKDTNEGSSSKEIAISSISLNKSSLILEVGVTSYLTVTYMPTNASDKSTTWRSTDNKVVNVSNKGMVTAVSSGSAAIIVSCGGIDAYCNITVKEKINSVQQQKEKTSSNGNMHNGHEWVDLGLSVLWATSNVGASKPEDYGDYYAWGETETKTEYQWSTYLYSNDDYGKLTKYCSDRTKGYNSYIDRRTKLELSDDVANQKWGGSWRMPTIVEINELLNNCTLSFTTINGINGCKITSKKPGYTDRFIFLPAAGFQNGTSVTYVGNYGEYWSSSLSADFSDYAYGIHFIYNQIVEKGNNGIDLRLIGRSVRPVLNIESLNNASATNDNNSTSEKYNYSNTQDKYEYVDLGLSVNWATCNVGATKPEDYGNYYAWGETEPKNEYKKSNYKWSKGSSRTLTKYNTDSSYGTVDNKLVLDIIDDVANAKWGNNWRIPTKAELDELRNNCTWTWTTLNGVKGYRVTGKKYGYTDRSIFLPAAGYWNGSSVSQVGKFGAYRSSNGRTDYPDRASGVNFGPYNVNQDSGDRYLGYSIRPVFQ